MPILSARVVGMRAHGGRKHRPKGHIMCWLCDHPGSTRQDYLDVLRGLARKNGWAVQYVDAEPPFAYTLGLADAGLPELLITALPPERSLTSTCHGRWRSTTVRPGAADRLA
ncbi:DUF4262 domain-containing protein [Mycobacterium sp. C31M]